MLAGCAWHTVRRRCPYGIVMGARAAGTLRGLRASGYAATGRLRTCTLNFKPKRETRAAL